ncbi:MAG: hypothetical protein ABI621_02555 [Chloroflexota bacterium]
MNKNVVNRLGAIFSVLVGVSYLIIGVIQLLLPADQTCDCADLFWLSYLNEPFGLTVQYAAFALTGILGIQVVMAVSDAIRADDVGWLRWTRNLAMIGFALTAIDNFHALDINRAKAFAFVNTLGAKAPLSIPGAMSGLDVNGWFRFGAIGLWVLVVSLLVLRSSAWPKALAYVGIALAVAYFLILASGIFELSGLTLIGAGIGGIILAPIWYIWMGLRLSDSSAATIIH